VVLKFLTVSHFSGVVSGIVVLAEGRLIGFVVETFLEEGRLPSCPNRSTDLFDPMGDGRAFDGGASSHIGGTPISRDKL
jgi:hypothetical protein